MLGTISLLFSMAAAAPFAASAPRGTPKVGVTTVDMPWSLAGLDSFETLAGRRADVAMYYLDWAHFPDFQADLVAPITARGMMPVLTWEPWDYTLEADQPAYRLSKIIDGTYDAHIRRWADGIAGWGQPLTIRFAHEMNGTWYPWSEGANGNSRGEYVVAWRHVRALFDQAAARNVTWIWSPNVAAAGYTALAPLAPLYPGDRYVDIVGLDGYNWGTSQAWSRWQTVPEIFDQTLRAVRQITHRRVFITETASAEGGGDKAGWISSLFDWLSVHPEVEAVLWFDHNKEADWRIESSGSAVRAFASGWATMAR